MPDLAPSHDPQWSHEPLEETLDGARRLSVSVADRMVRGGWEAMARVVGIPARRWTRHHPLGGDVAAGQGAPLVAMVDGRAAFDAAAWAKFVSLVPGAAAMPTRTAELFGVRREAVRPPGRRPAWIVDVLRASRMRRRLARTCRRLDAEHALHAARVEAAVEQALAPTEGVALEDLPPYALAARLDELLRATSAWEFPAAVDVAASIELTDWVHRRAGDPRDESAVADAWERVLELQSRGGGNAAPLRHLEDLAAIDPADGDELAAWRDGPGGWHASRDLLLESPPLRDDVDRARLVAAAYVDGMARVASVHHDDANDDGGLVRRLTRMREVVGRDRALHVAGIRALIWTLARSLAATGELEDADDAFDLDVADLLRLARGGDVATSSSGMDRRSGSTGGPDEVRSGDAPLASRSAPREVRGLAASRGTASGRVVLLDDPALDADVDDAVLVCRVTDPAWLPLMLRCAALVTERGGPLSHAAIVAREIGLPAVVGAAGVRAAAAAARTAAVDGSNGVVAFDPAP